MTLTDPAIIGIVALLVTCIPGVRWLSRTIHRKLRSRQNNSSNRNTVLPLSDRSSPLFGPPEGVCIDPCVAYPIRATGQVTRMWMPPSPTIPGSEGFVSPTVDCLVGRTCANLSLGRCLYDRSSYLASS